MLLLQLPSPHVVVRGRRFHGHRHGALAPDDVPVVALRLLLPREVEIAAVSVEPGPGLEHRGPPVAVGGAYAGFAQIVHRRPHEVADEIGQALHQRPVFRGLLGIALQPAHHAARISRVVALVFVPEVVVSADVEALEGFVRLGLPVAAGRVPRVAVVPSADGGGDGACGIETEDVLTQPCGRLHPFG